MPRILYIVPADYEALKAKGVEEMIFERDEYGFFERVVTIHPIATRNRVIEFNKVFVLHELDPDVFSRFFRSRFLRALFSPLHFVRVVIATFKLVRRERIDLIRANDPYWIGLIGLFAAKLTHRPLCVSIHSDFDKRLELTGGGDTFTFFGINWPARAACRIVLSSADMILPIRGTLGKWAVDNGASIDRIRVIPHGIDIESLCAEKHRDVRSMLNIPTDRKIISFVGRLSPENYLSDIIKMARTLAARRDDFCLVIAGGGEMEGSLTELLAADSRLNSVVRLVGFQPRKICFALRCQSAVSLCLMGGFSLIEACLAGQPVISYDVEWHHELVETGRTGFLIPEKDVDGVLRAVELCLDEPSTAATLGTQARIRAVSRHELKNASHIKRTCFEELLR